MINALKCRVTFVSSGFTLDSDFQPQTGITAVVGPNGVGKTFSTIELTRYLLYGKKALRGAASGYKTLEAKGDFIIRGERYRIERTPEHEFIENEAGTVLAVNAKAVTEKVTELMGYGLDVFDVCNASVQGKGHLFSEKTPAERKRMIDQVVGLASNETIEKACRTEATVLRREVEAMTKSLVLPPKVTSAWPGGFSDDIEKLLTEGLAARREYDRVSALIVPVAKPSKPSMGAPAEIDIKMAQDHEDQRRDYEKQRAGLQAFLDKPVPAVTYTDAELEQASKRHVAKVALEALGRQPALTLDEIEQYQREWALYETHLDGTCPNCGCDLSATHTKPDVSQTLLREERLAHIRWDGVDATLPDGFDLNPKQIRDARTALDHQEAIKEATDALTRIPVLDDRSGQLERLRGRKSENMAYLEAMVRYEHDNQANIEHEAALEALGEPPSSDDLQLLTEQLAEAKVFEAQWRAYNDAKIIYDNALAAIEDKRNLADEFKKGSEALADARATIKAFLAPALSRVASTLIHDMTHGKLSHIMIDDDMNIMVNSQTLETLSGGGLTAANIALRIALGQVLIADTFPVFLGDEIDADVDDIRREAIADALVGLKKHLAQIILVTHRNTTGFADHVHDLHNH